MKVEVRRQGTTLAFNVNTQSNLSTAQAILLELKSNNHVFARISSAAYDDFITDGFTATDLTTGKFHVTVSPLLTEKAQPGNVQLTCKTLHGDNLEEEFAEIIAHMQASTLKSKHA